jgi:hypothetical protein
MLSVEIVQMSCWVSLYLVPLCWMSWRPIYGNINITVEKILWINNQNMPRKVFSEKVLVVLVRKGGWLSELRLPLLQPFLLPFPFLCNQLCWVILIGKISCQISPPGGRICFSRSCLKKIKCHQIQNQWSEATKDTTSIDFKKLCVFKQTSIDWWNGTAHLHVIQK